MEINFENITDHTIPINDFSLNGRFIENLPLADLHQLKPLNNMSSKFLDDFITTKQLHKHAPFKKGFFNKADKIKITNDNHEEVRNWLLEHGISLTQEVFLSWDTTTTMITPWKLLIQYFDDFHYTASDDLTVFDESLDWALLFSRKNVIYYGAK
jgi:hypothetical protein